MTTVIIVIHLMVVLAMIGLVLLQRSEGGALGIGGGGGAFMSGRSAGNVLTRATGVLAAVFFATSIGLALVAKLESRPSDILERLPGQAAPVTAPAAPATGFGEVPATAEEMLRQLGGSTPQTPPADAPAADSPAPASPAAQAPAAEPAPPAAAPATPAAPEAPGSGPQTPPAAPQ